MTWTASRPSRSRRRTSGDLVERPELFVIPHKAHPEREAMFFSQEAIEEMAGSYGSMDERAEALVVAFASFDFKNDRAREFATHGFSRRIRTLTHCIENVFNRLPPDDDAIPTTEACVEAAAYVQAFLFNVFGALDNLAWTWVQEKDIKNQDGGQLKETRVGLGKKYRDIRRTFSPQFRKYLDGHQD